MIFASAVFFGGCSREVAGLDEGDFRDPLIRKAQARIRQGDKDGAVNCLKKALERKPELAQADLELALLYDDYKKDYISAIYHYQRYLELRPKTQKRNLIEDLIRKAKMSFAASVSDQYPETGKKLQALEEENARLKADLFSARQDLREVRENLAGLQAGKAARAMSMTTQMKETKENKTAGWPRACPVLASHAQRVASVPSGFAEKPPPALQGQTSSSTGTVYCVQEGDTLSIIASKVYNNPRKWKIIFDANTNVLASPERLKKGQTLVIPK